MLSTSSTRTLAESDEFVLGVLLLSRLDLRNVVPSDLTVAEVLGKLIGRLGNLVLESRAHEASLRVGDRDEEISRRLTVLRPAKRSSVRLRGTEEKIEDVLVAHVDKVIDGSSHGAEVGQATFVNNANLVEQRVDLLSRLAESKRC